VRVVCMYVRMYICIYNIHISCPKYPRPQVLEALRVSNQAWVLEYPRLCVTLFFNWQDHSLSQKNHLRPASNYPQAGLGLFCKLHQRDILSLWLGWTL